MILFILLCMVIIYKYFSKEEGFYCAWKNKAQNAKYTMGRQKSAYYSEKAKFDSQLKSAREALGNKLSEVSTNNNLISRLYNDGTGYDKMGDIMLKIQNENLTSVQSFSKTNQTLKMCDVDNDILTKSIENNS